MLIAHPRVQYQHSGRERIWSSGAPVSTVIKCVVALTRVVWGRLARRALAVFPGRDCGSLGPSASFRGRTRPSSSRRRRPRSAASPPGTPPRPSRTSTWATPARTGSAATGSSTGAPPPRDSPPPAGLPFFGLPFAWKVSNSASTELAELEYPSSTRRCITAGCSNASSSSRASTNRAWRRGGDALFSWSSAGKPSKSMDRAAPGAEDATEPFSASATWSSLSLRLRIPRTPPFGCCPPARTLPPRLAVGLRIGLRFVGLLFGGVSGGFSPPRVFFGDDAIVNLPSRASSPSSTNASPALALPPRLVGRLPSEPLLSAMLRSHISFARFDGTDPLFSFGVRRFPLTESSCWIMNGVDPSLCAALIDSPRYSASSSGDGSGRRAGWRGRDGGRVSARVGEGRGGRVRGVRGRAGIAGGAGLGARARAARVASRARPFTVIHDLSRERRLLDGEKSGGTTRAGGGAGPARATHLGGTSCCRTPCSTPRRGTARGRR